MIKFLELFFIAFFGILLLFAIFGGIIWLIVTYTSGIATTICILVFLAFISAIFFAINEA